MSDRAELLEERLRRRFRVEESAIAVAGERLTMLHPASADELISEEDFERDERLPYWADVWPSARVLAARVLGEAGTGRRALELGCGAGLVAACALRAGFDVTATDYYDDALLFTRVNGWRIAGREPEVRIVDWRHMPPDLGRYDLVLASDVLYERAYAALVARAIVRTLRRGGRAIVADPGRIAVEEFVQACDALGLGLVEREVVPFVEGEIKQKITLFTFARG